MSWLVFYHTKHHLTSTFCTEELPETHAVPQQVITKIAELLFRHPQRHLKPQRHHPATSSAQHHAIFCDPVIRKPRDQP